MRGIKFRVWNMYEYISLNEAIYDDIVYIQQPSSSKNSMIEINWDGVELEQFTGMLDTNGVEIYEGDVVAIPECKELKVVEWSVKSCCFVLMHLPSKQYSENFYFEEFSQITVVGNIHQHAYLLGTK